VDRYEALILLLWYAAYVTFMKYNEVVEKFVKKFVTNRSKVDKITTGKAETPPPMVSLQNWVKLYLRAIVWYFR
jgi:hypothetical protein